MKYTNKRFNNNLDEVMFEGVGKYNIQIIAPERWVPCEWIGYNYAATCKNRCDTGIHFFVDDYQFERIWRNWKRYADVLRQYAAIMTPDFSTFTDWPVAVQLWNHYRKHYLGAYFQQQGLRVYPTISWSDKSSYEWCFDGEPVGSTVCVSSVGTQRNAESKRLFLNGYQAMMERLHPETVIFYGAVPDECKGNIVRIKAFQDKFREVKIDDWD